jgi:hypothetical protein
VTDPVLLARRAHEGPHLRELVAHATYMVLEPWAAGVAGRQAT